MRMEGEDLRFGDVVEDRVVQGGENTWFIFCDAGDGKGEGEGEDVMKGRGES